MNLEEGVRIDLGGFKWIDMCVSLGGFGG